MAGKTSAALTALRAATGNSEAQFESYFIDYLRGQGPVHLGLLKAGERQGLWSLPSEERELYDAGFRARLFCQAATGGTALTSRMQVWCSPDNRAMT
jgi:hypothetical protein